MVKRNAASSKRKAKISTTTAAASSTPSTRSSTRITAVATTTTPLTNKRKKVIAKDEVAMFGKSKKSRQSNGSKSQNILEMFQTLAEDPEDPNAVITMEGKPKLHCYMFY